MSAVPRPRITPTRRGVWHRIKRSVRIAFLRFEIDSAEQWLAECARDGIYDSQQIQHLNRHVQELRVQLAITEAS